MKLLAFIPIKLTLLLILGILIGYFFQIEPFPILVITLSLFLILTIAFVVLKKENRILFGVLAALCFTALGTYCYAQAQPIYKQDHYSKKIKNKNPLWNLKVTEVLKPNMFSQRYIASVLMVDKENASGKILLSLPLDKVGESLQVDDEIFTFSELKPISKPLNPYQFDYSKYMSKLGVYDQLHIKPKYFIKNDKPTTTLFGKAAKIRNKIISNLKKARFGKEELSIIQALLLGQRSDISQETYANYQKAGAVHILAVSGLHIGILLVIIQFLLSPLKYIIKGRTLILLLSVILLWYFAFLVGLSASIVRATTMFSFVAYALHLNRPSNSFNILALSVLFILLFIDPNLLFQVGFQMSYAAVFAILWIYPLLQKLWYPKNKITRYIWQLLSVSIAAQLGVLPISLYYFHQFPGLFFISNLVIVPALGIILGIGILVVVLSSINFLPEQLVEIYNALISWINKIIAWVAQQESFIFSSIPFDGIQLILSFIAITFLILAVSKFTFKRICLFLISLICFQGWTIFQNYNTVSKNEILILHQTKNTLLFNKSGKKLSVLTNKVESAERLIANYTVGERIKKVKFDSLKNSYSLHSSNFIILDSLGIYPKNMSNGILLLTKSPKINLNRLIEENKPQQIIADGSNYNSYINRWSKTCKKYKIPFHYTGEKGVYYFE